MPGRMTKAPIDTSARYRDTARAYYVFERVKMINSSDDEWAISYLTEKKAAITYTDQGLNKTMLYRMFRNNEGTLESGIGVPVEGHIGAFSVKNKDIAFSATSSDGMFSIGNSDIYFGKVQGNMIIDSYSLADSIDPKGYSWDAQPALSPDANVIFFASDRQPSHGGTDIWYCVKSPNGKWSSPINCGSAINSRCDELTPFVSADGKRLLFASSGHATIGGYDIFTSNISDEFWKTARLGNVGQLGSGANYFSEPENMLAPLNTPFDELFPSSPANDDEILYYSSNQAAQATSVVLLSGGFDIYLRTKYTRAVIPQQKAKDVALEGPKIDDNLPVVPVATPDLSRLGTPDFLLDGIIYNARTKLVVPNAEVSIREIPNPALPMRFASKIMKDTLRYKVRELEQDREYEITSSSNDAVTDKFKIRKVGNDTLIVVNADTTGKYEVRLEKDREFEVTAQAADLFFDSYKIRVEKKDTITEDKHDFFVPEELALRVNFPTNIYNNPYKFTIDSNGVETNKTWQEEIDLLAQNILLAKGKIKQLKLIGNTDDVGSVDYNYKLGLNRVKFVVAELIKRGVPEEMLIAESAGKLNPLPRRNKESNDLYRKRLRRVDLQKIM